MEHSRVEPWRAVRWRSEVAGDGKDGEDTKSKRDKSGNANCPCKPEAQEQVLVHDRPCHTACCERVSDEVSLVDISRLPTPDPAIAMPSAVLLYFEKWVEMAERHG